MTKTVMHAKLSDPGQTEAACICVRVDQVQQRNRQILWPFQDYIQFATINYETISCGEISCRVQRMDDIGCHDVPNRSTRDNRNVVLFVHKSEWNIQRKAQFDRLRFFHLC